MAAKAPDADARQPLGRDGRADAAAAIYTVWPPSTTRACPTTNLAASEHNQRTASGISQGVTLACGIDKKQPIFPQACRAAESLGLFVSRTTSRRPHVRFQHES